MTQHRSYSGHTILITGASSGIGEALAREFASRGADVVLSARRQDRLEALAEEIRRDHGRRADVVPADLSDTDGVRQLLSTLDEREIRITGLINNAGFGKITPLHEQDPDEVHRMINLNVTALTDLTVALLPRLRSSTHGLLVNIASVAAYQPIPEMAVYAATKAYVLSFTEALWAESRGTSLKVLAVSPGPTETEFFEVAGHSADGGLPRATAAAVVETTLTALDRKDTPPSVAVGRSGTAAALAGRMTPRRLLLPALRRGMSRRK
ncbi:SDR family oxidoreductase [Falsarthrobacter nasiphocae]|uniref:Short-subunit dehydrogenase n=1 Tax=Falsarthrobacter nasiphocae TaxID=189863 RepID=A0AAE3YD40_9MICC|nr:SDR family oxidoreductase [Falsarthrobacter nasiphocae]MDR6891194.1 short-subunit dehydrogenase [Falsarthrobacter nasiphocae]